MRFRSSANCGNTEPLTNQTVQKHCHGPNRKQCATGNQYINYTATHKTPMIAMAIHSCIDCQVLLPSCVCKSGRKSPLFPCWKGAHTMHDAQITHTQCAVASNPESSWHRAWSASLFSADPHPRVWTHQPPGCKEAMTQAWSRPRPWQEHQNLRTNRGVSVSVSKSASMAMFGVCVCVCVRVFSI